jgi:hypothetical protein
MAQVLQKTKHFCAIRKLAGWPHRLAARPINPPVLPRPRTDEQETFD